MSNQETYAEWEARTPLAPEAIDPEEQPKPPSMWQNIETTVSPFAGYLGAGAAIYATGVVVASAMQGGTGTIPQFLKSIGAGMAKIADKTMDVIQAAPWLQDADEVVQLLKTPNFVNHLRDSSGARILFQSANGQTLFENPMLQKSFERFLDAEASAYNTMDEAIDAFSRLDDTQAILNRPSPYLIERGSRPSGTTATSIEGQTLREGSRGSRALRMPIEQARENWKAIWKANKDSILQLPEEAIEEAMKKAGVKGSYRRAVGKSIKRASVESLDDVVLAWRNRKMFTAGANIMDDLARIAGTVQWRHLGNAALTALKNPQTYWKFAQTAGIATVKMGIDPTLAATQSGIGMAREAYRGLHGSRDMSHDERRDQLPQATFWNTVNPFGSGKDTLGAHAQINLEEWIDQQIRSAYNEDTEMALLRQMGIQEIIPEPYEE